MKNLSGIDSLRERLQASYEQELEQVRIKFEKAISSLALVEQLLGYEPSAQPTEARTKAASPSAVTENGEQGFSVNGVFYEGQVDAARAAGCSQSWLGQKMFGKSECVLKGVHVKRVGPIPGYQLRELQKSREADISVAASISKAIKNPAIVPPQSAMMTMCAKCGDDAQPDKFGECVKCGSSQRDVLPVRMNIGGGT